MEYPYEKKKLCPSTVQKTSAGNGVSFAADDTPLYMGIISKFHINKYLYCKKGKCNR